MGRKAKTLPGDVIESFYGVYLLLCANPRFKGRTYVGFTVDPNRRIQQHNHGKEKGGAWQTHNKGPWNMVLIIHGFPNQISALRFEWAWQHPQRSRRLRHVSLKKPREAAYDFKLRVLSEMLCVGPWCRLPLTIRWLLPDNVKELPESPPKHMAICYGPVVSKKKRPQKKSMKETEAEEEEPEEFTILVCCICGGLCSKTDVLKCLLKDCSMEAHNLCLAKHFLKEEENHIVPVEGFCPKCGSSLLWGDLIRKMKGCYSSLGEEQDGKQDVCDLSDYETEMA